MYGIGYKNFHPKLNLNYLFTIYKSYISLYSSNNNPMYYTVNKDFLLIFLFLFVYSLSQIQP